MEQEGALLKLPPDALLAVLGKLNPQDLLRCACCCRLLSALSYSDCLWMTLCNRWRLLLNLPAWRFSFHSALALFRILSSLDPLVGPWTAVDQQPRGSLLYITWGSSCLVACKVLACLTGELKLVKAFEIFGCQDGSFRVELISKDPQNIPHTGLRLPGKLVWDPKNASEFSVEANEQMEGFVQTVSQDGMIQPDDRSFLMQLLRPYQVGRGHDHVQPPGLIFPDIRVLEEVQDATSEQVTRARRVNLLQHLLDHRVANEEDQHGSQELTGVSFSQRALQYLLRLSSPARNNLGLEGQSNEASSMEERQIVRRSYARLTIAEATPETDLVGLWMGVYGPHGAEIIHVTQRDEGIFGTKVLGDPNVPCGEVSFRANLYFETCEVPVELQQIVDLQMRSSTQAFHIVKMYEGYGRIAGHNFRNPLWVPGHLLVSGNNQIAFLWEDVNFVVPFEKLDLESLYQSQKHLGLIL
ncbi:hypothetical protein L7F22_033425 [Adiantum nelumboides]|nr:hypothetical protein [Adiantum nelumboides]